jgi:Antitoxin VbhA
MIMTNTAETLTEMGANDRARTVGLALHSWEVEGANADDETKADMIDFAMGDIDSDEVVRRTRARYGLD